MTVHHLNAAKDAAVVAGTLTTVSVSVLADWLETGLAIIALILGIVLTVYRIRINQREWREGESKD